MDKKRTVKSQESNSSKDQDIKEMNQDHDSSLRAQIPGRKSLKSKKVDPANQQTQYPADMGYHGTDDEKNLNPEE